MLQGIFQDSMQRAVLSAALHSNNDKQQINFEAYRGSYWQINIRIVGRHGAVLKSSFAASIALAVKQHTQSMYRYIRQKTRLELSEGTCEDIPSATDHFCALWALPEAIAMFLVQSIFLPCSCPPCLLLPVEQRKCFR